MPFRNAGGVTLSTTSRGLESILVLDLRLNLSIAPFKNGPRRSEAKAGDPKPRRPRSSPWRLDLDQWSRLLEAHAADDALHDEGVTYYLLLNDLRPTAPVTDLDNTRVDKIDKKRLHAEA